MIILNPGSLHYNPALSTHLAALDMSDYKNAATTVASLNNNPSAVTS